MKMVLLMAMGLLSVGVAGAQASVYVDFSASKLTNLVDTTVLYGPTVGLSGQVAKLHNVNLSADFRGSFLGGSGKRLDGLVIGPRASFVTHRFEPYAEFMVGFARFNDGLGAKNSSSTDSELEFNGGVDRRVTKRFDWRVFEFSYGQYYGLGGEYNPKTFSTGIVFHGAKH